ncbi:MULTISPECIES: DUF5665 domain-containing protein [Maritimibacter]|jgi:hypothetical protein|uniref:Uncharacterized protein n=1 Tax=Maritimibacter alkaliphilus HTCC2654 TaxID=314271 RepID=A3VCI0_9RHOB|nr:MULTISPECIES: DUF5665 domain-containing protein [Maritimibacter]EAQ13846.1 hypothetical protein RB2654_12274 [Maritimibacter alkaliphilus HTCC2654]MBL6427670.1 hypothetical protein [Maritimibacter sp.]TYP84043.1 hypothetical protein BD830_102132 [Maritimibacter alkaliphilus HTCC2654]
MAENDRYSDIADEIDGLRAEVAKLNGHRYIRLHDNLWKLGLFQLFRGLAFGLGSVLGATFLVSVAAYLLAQIDFIPIIGDWAADIAREIDADNAESYGIAEETGEEPASADETDDEAAAEENPSPGGQPAGDDGIDRGDFGITAPDAE